jgi:hypothetical protein
MEDFESRLLAWLRWLTRSIQPLRVTIIGSFHARPLPLYPIRPSLCSPLHRYTRKAMAKGLSLSPPPLGLIERETSQ